MGRLNDIKQKSDYVVSQLKERAGHLKAKNDERLKRIVSSFVNEINQDALVKLKVLEETEGTIKKIGFRDVAEKAFTCWFSIVNKEDVYYIDFDYCFHLPISRPSSIETSFQGLSRKDLKYFETMPDDIFWKILESDSVLSNYLTTGELDPFWDMENQTYLEATPNTGDTKPVIEEPSIYTNEEGKRMISWSYGQLIDIKKHYESWFDQIRADLSEESDDIDDLKSTVESDIWNAVNGYNSNRDKVFYL